MPMKGEGEPEDWEEVDTRDDGFGWIAYPEEQMQRASHALATDDGVWLLDPVDVHGLDDRLDELGEVTGVAILLDRHKRDAAELATRYDVPVSIPAWMDGVEDALDAPVERFTSTLGDTDYRAIRVIDNRFWQECAVTDGDVLYVPESVGTTPYFRGSDDPLGVHPMLRVFPPRRALGNESPQHLLVGHGAGIHENAGGALSDALTKARTTAPRLYVRTIRHFLPI